MEVVHENLAAMDIGSHTARLLVVQWSHHTGVFRPLLRKRAYIRLARDFEVLEAKSIKHEAIERTLRVLDDFVGRARELGAKDIMAVATGVVREAINQDRLINAIQARTGIGVRVISGEEEALLTGLGVLHALHLNTDSLIIFDLGGGTTEFLIGAKEEKRALSLPFGAAVLTQKYISSDPAQDTEIERLRQEVWATLGHAFGDIIGSLDKDLLVGTGGTVTTLAAIIHRIAQDDIRPERVNGLVLTREEIEDLFSSLRKMRVQERVDLLGLDEGRADVILAGCLIVLSLVEFFEASRLMVSFSDLLEGILIDYCRMEGVKILSS